MVAVQTPLQTTIFPEGSFFSHFDADEVSKLVTGRIAAKRIIIDMGHTEGATTSAFARLVLLRRSLLKTGRDLRLINLHHQAAGLYEMFRLANVLPSM